ncbi:hypothetical protein D3C76_1761120 [compost metagenome]
MESSEIRILANINSFQLFRNWKMMTVAMAGVTTGITTRRNNRYILAPSIHAASSISNGISRMKP